MDLDITNIDRLWTLLDASGDGELTAEELVKGVARLKGTAKSVDMNHLVGQHDKVVMQMVAELKHVVRTLDLLSGKVNTAVSAINTLSSNRGDGAAGGGQTALASNFKDWVPEEERQHPGREDECKATA